MIEFMINAIDRVFIQQDRWQLWLNGMRATMTMTTFGLMLGIVVGLFIAIIRVSHDSTMKPHICLQIPNRFVKMYVTTIRGIPVVVQLLIFNFIILAASRNAILIGSLAFGFNSGAYVSETFRAGIMSIDKGQMEAGRSLGLSYAQTMMKIILPQALKNSLPALCNEFISLFKETSIAGMAAITDVTHVGNVIRGLTFNPAPLFFVAAFYLIVVVILEFFVGILERRLRRSDLR